MTKSYHPWMNFQPPIPTKFLDNMLLPNENAGIPTVCDIALALYSKLLPDKVQGAGQVTSVLPFQVFDLVLVSTNLMSGTSGVPTIGFSTGSALGPPLGSCNSQQSYAHVSRALRLSCKHKHLHSYNHI